MAGQFSPPTKEPARRAAEPAVVDADPAEQAERTTLPFDPARLFGLQRSVGNARVQRLLAGVIQRDTGTPPPAPAAGPTGVAAPAMSASDQELILKIEVVEKVRQREADRRKQEAKIAATGQPDLRPSLGQPVPDTSKLDETSVAMLASVGLTRLPEDERADQKAQQFLTPPGPTSQSLESQLSIMFENRMVEVTHFLLDRNKAVAERERDRYTAGNPTDVKGLKDAAWALSEANKEVSIGKSLMDASKQKGGDLAGATIRDFAVRLKKFNDLLKVHGLQYPILHTPGLDFLLLSRTNNAAVAKLLSGPAAKVLADIATTNDHLKKGELDLWTLGRVRVETRRHLGIKDGSAAAAILDKTLAAKTRSQTYTAIAEAAIMIAVSLAAALPGLQPLALTGAALLSAMSAHEAYKHYTMEAAAAGSAIDSASAIGSEYPDGFWIAVAICGAVVDAGAALMAFREIVAGLKIAKEAGDIEKAVQKGVGTIPEAKYAIDPKTNKPFTAAVLVGRVKDKAVAQFAKVLASEKLGGIVQDVLKGIIAGKPFKVLDDTACKLLLKQHGNWKQLVEELLRSGPKGEKVAVGLQQHRQRVLATLERRFGAKTLPDASLTAVSDVDLNIAGRGAGAKVLDAEAFMAKEFGAGWAEAYRMAFYTDSSRLLAYRSVLEGLTEAEKAAYLKKALDRLTPRITLLNEAKSLAHAGEDAAAAARVRERAGKLGLDVSAVEREAGRLKSAAAPEERAKLLKEVDGLTERLGAKDLSPGARQDLALEISMKQLEANFLSKEAYIAPAAMLGPGKVGSVTEAFHGAHSQLEMLEHILHECGGDVAVAMREYEAYKYINRFSQFAMAGGIPDAEFQAFSNIAEYVYRTNRTAQRAAATIITDDLLAGATKFRPATAAEVAEAKVATGKLPGVTRSGLVVSPDENIMTGGKAATGGFYIRPADSGVAQAALSDDTVRQLYGSFNKKANDALPKLQKAGLEGRPVTQPLPPKDTPPPLRQGGSGPDSGPPTVRNPGPGDALPPTVRSPDGGPPRRLDLSTPEVYEVRDSSNPNQFFCRAWVNEDGLLQTEMHAVRDGKRSTVLNILQIMGEINQKFGQRAKGIFATWMGSSNTNIQALNAALREGLPLEKALFKTVEGQTAKRAGFTQATVLKSYMPSSTPGEYHYVQVQFGRPGVGP